MPKFDSSGREILATLWSAIQEIPDMIGMLSVLPDPNYNAWLYWDDNINELVMLEALAENVPYDNATSGLSADNVQDAIDEIVVGTQPYAGFVRGSLGASATIKVNGPATGWTVAQQATGRFRITTTGLTLADATDMARNATARISAGGTDDRFANITNETTTYFDVTVTDVGSGLVNEDFYFECVILVPP